MLREIERRTGKPGGFIETDLVDPRYFSPANMKNRLESYFQMIEQKRARPPASAAVGKAPDALLHRHRSGLDHDQGHA